MKCLSQAHQWQARFQGYRSCRGCGLTVSTAEAPVFAYTDDYAASYFDHLDQDRNHYLQKVAHHTKPVYDRVNRIIEIGGGFPHHSLLNRREDTKICVQDLRADVYAGCLARFSDRIAPLYPDLRDLVYDAAPLAQLRETLLTAPSTTLVAMHHFLEHLPLAEVEDLLAILNDSPARVLIYGPNIAVADGDDWLHFRCTGGNQEHLTFLPRAGLRDLLGNKVCVLDVAVDHDYCLVFEPREGGVPCES